MEEDERKIEDQTAQYQEMPEDDEVDEEEDSQFDHLIPQNWEQIADMRLRQLDKEYNQCAAFEMGAEKEYKYQGLTSVLGIEERLKMISNTDLESAV